MCMTICRGPFAFRDMILVIIYLTAIPKTFTPNYYYTHNNTPNMFCVTSLVINLTERSKII